MTSDNDDDEEEDGLLLTGFSESSSVRGAASLKPREMSKAIAGAKWKERPLSRKYVNKLNADSRDREESLFLKVRKLVERLRLDPQESEAVYEKAEVQADRMRKGDGDDDVKEKEEALAAVVRVMQGYGWSLAQVAGRMAAIDRWIVAVEDLRVSVLLDVTHGKVPSGNHCSGNAGLLSVRVGGEERKVDVLENGARFTKLLRIPAFATDDGKVIELSGASIWTREERPGGGGQQALVCPTERRRLEVLDAHRAVVRVGDSFEALKLVKRVELRSGHSPATEQQLTKGKEAREGQAKLLLRRYNTEKLPVTEYLANSVGALMKLRSRYAQCFVEKFDPRKVQERLRNHRDGDEGPLLRSPRLLAHEALYQADEEVFAALPRYLRLTVARLATERGLSDRDRKRVGVTGFLVESELKAWEKP